MKNEMSRRQFLGFAGSAAAVLGLGLVGCGGSAGSGSSASGDAAEVYFLQFKPEVDKEWKEIAKAYKKEKGVEVKIVTAASNTYEEKLKSEMSKSSAPTLFQVNGPTGLKNWKDYCADLSDTKLRGELIDDSLALQSDGKDLGIDWVQESYGIIYNKELLEKAGYKAEDINSFDKLKACADDIQARKDELGVDGAFTSAGMDDSSSWRYTTHLANLPLYYEFEKEHNQEDDEIKGEYLDNFKQIFDLYITDSTCDPSQLASKTGDDATNEFATGQGRLLSERLLGLRRPHQGRYDRRPARHAADLHRRRRRGEPGPVLRRRELLVRQLPGFRGCPEGHRGLHVLVRHF